MNTLGEDFGYQTPTMEQTYRQTVSVDRRRELELDEAFESLRMELEMKAFQEPLSEKESILLASARERFEERAAERNRPTPQMRELAYLDFRLRRALARSGA